MQNNDHFHSESFNFDYFKTHHAYFPNEARLLG